jgi:hypothetical protein
MAPQPATIKRTGTSAILATVAREPEPEVATRSIPLPLRALLEPYKAHEKVTLRIERLPQRARLSAGQNNGDQSWSVAPDEFDNLIYLLPADIEEEHSLAIRVISRIDGATVVVLSLQVTPKDTAPDAPRSPPGPRAVSRASDAETKALRDELAHAKAALALSEAEAGERIRETEEAWKKRSRELVDAALLSAKAEWDAEFSGRLKSVADRAEQTMVARRTAWQSELDASISETEKRAEKARAEGRESAKREADAALAAAREGWRRDEAQRLAAAESRLREEARAAEASWQARSQKGEQDSAELVRLRERLAETEKLSEARERELANARSALGSTRESVQREADASLVRAKAGWASEEGKRLSELETRLRAEADAALAEGAARRERAERALSEAVKQIELLSTRRAETGTASNDDMAGLRSELASAHAALAQAREQGVKDLEARLAEARALWKSEEEARFATAEVRYRAQSSATTGEVSDLRARSDAAVVELRGKGLLLEAEEQKRRDLEAQLRTLEASLKADQAQSRQSAELALANARKEWSAGEAARLKEAESRWRADLTDAAARAERAERQLADASAQREAAPRERVENLKLRDELEKVRLTVEMRDLELTQARKEFPPVATESMPSLAPLKKGRMAMRDDPVTKEEKQRKGRSLVRDIVVVVFVILLIALVAFSRPWIEPLLPYSLQDDLDQSFGDLYGAAPASPAKPQNSVPAPVAPAPVTGTVLRAANLHSAPSKSSAVVATLPAGSKVVPLEQQGGWVHVSVGTAATGQEGWVYSSYLSAAGQ